ncbi:hypothetical protein ISF_08504 [Cordyceps fumosorosea ARSEF 2679]|uniref:Uncharacterized protein n=1 Tax=Cordyceps fumosorosea (strain ARSEF 2679) TaxID=1081104 RepID=A0A167M766_CORFA|nr:hypothetical protein ISF_08504 [Cordyceps fumosorosea ARSEF 2679]OAA54024.1 hypothetical protein ISF_08504 [Cordyceps fumosorosea ARSEF 2679]
MKLASILVAVGAAMAAPASDDSSNMLVAMGKDALDAQSYSEFANCVNGLDTAYKAYADAGVLVVIPPTSRAIDPDGKDKELWNCIQSSSSKVSLAAESTEFHDPAQEASIDAKSIQHAKAVSMGVTGQKEVGRVAARTDGLETRQANVYAVHFSDHAGCQGDFNHFNLGACINYWSAYASTMADNLHATRRLRYTVWPHHNCGQGNQRVVEIAPRTSSACIDRTTYSWRGVLL